MSTLYGDNIFDIEINLEELYINFIEESKNIFNDFDDILTEDASSFKERIIAIINKIIQKIKDFVKWIKTTVESIFNKISSELKSSNLKKFVQDAKDKLKNKSTNESSILIEATYNDLEDLLKRTLVPYYKINEEPNKILDQIRTDSNKLKVFKIEGVNLLTGSDFPIIEHKTCSMEIFIDRYFEENRKELMLIKNKIKDSCNDFEKSVKDLESIRSNIKSKDINSVDDLKDTIRALKNTESIEDISKKYQCAIQSSTKVIDYTKKALREIKKTEQFIREKVEEKVTE